MHGRARHARVDRPTLRSAQRGRHGFTLIELIAVVLILGLAMSLVVPNLAATRSGRLRDQARQVAHRLEVARQRAITTGKHHQLFLDLEEGFMRIEWYVDEQTAWGEREEDEAAVAEEIDLDGPLPLSPPRPEADYHPISGPLGRDTFLDDDYYFVGLDSEMGWTESGTVWLDFAPDGTTGRAVIKLADAWDNEIQVEIEPLIELIHIREVGDG